jgi:hypothetical protein
MAGNLSQLELTLGAMAKATEHAEQAVTYADRSDDPFERLSKRAASANALHQVGRWSEAEARFCEAEEIQAAREAEYPQLYSLQGFYYGEFLLSSAERAAWQEHQQIEQRIPKEQSIAACLAVSQRAMQMRESTRVDATLLDIAFNCLTLGCAALFEAVLSSASASIAAGNLSEAVSVLRRAGAQHHVPRGLLARAWCSSAQAAQHRQHGRDKEAIESAKAAQADLDEAWEIASRGPMPLFMADIHLYRARLFGRITPYPWESKEHDLREARRLIEKHGYWRRKEELEDAEAALLR